MSTRSFLVQTYDVHRLPKQHVVHVQNLIWPSLLYKRGQLVRGLQNMLKPFPAGRQCKFRIFYASTLHRAMQTGVSILRLTDQRAKPLSTTPGRQDVVVFDRKYETKAQDANKRMVASGVSCIAAWLQALQEP